MGPSVCHGKVLASVSHDKTVRLWAVASGTERAVLRGHENWVYACAFSPDGQLLASASWDNTLRLWNVENGAAISLVDLNATVSCCSAHPHRNVFAVGAAAGEVALFELIAEHVE